MVRGVCAGGRCASGRGEALRVGASVAPATGKQQLRAAAAGHGLPESELGGKLDHPVTNWGSATQSRTWRRWVQAACWHETAGFPSV